jgi:hypothetical protein
VHGAVVARTLTRSGVALAASSTQLAARLTDEAAAAQQGVLGLLPPVPPARTIVHGATSGGSSRAEQLTCRAAGCAAPVSRNRGIGGRYRICDLHVATPVVELDGALQRFCQKCCKWQLLEAFDGDARTCAAQLDAARRRRTVAARRRRAAAAAPAAVAPAAAAPRRARAAPLQPPHAAAGAAAGSCASSAAADDALDAHAANDLEAWFSGDVGGLMDVLLEEEEQLRASGAGDTASAARAAFAAAVAGGPVAPLSSRGVAPTATQAGSRGGSLSRVSTSVKLYDTLPDDLPPSLQPDFFGWLSDYFRPDNGATTPSSAPAALCGVIQPGCTLLTVDALVPSASARAAGAAGAGAARALATCLLTGADAAFWRARAFDVRVAGDPGGVAVAPGGALRELRAEPRSTAADAADALPTLPPLRPAAQLSTCHGALRSDAPAAVSGQLRARLHGQLLCGMPGARAGAPLELTLPPTHAAGCLLLDLEPPALHAPPRAALLCADAAICAEVCALDGRGADALLAATGESRDDVLYCLGAALRRGASRRVVLAAAAGALCRGWAATAARLLAELPHAAPDVEAGALDDAEDGDTDDGDGIAPGPAAAAPPAAVSGTAAEGDTTLLHVAVSCGSPRMVQLVLNAATAGGAAVDADADADDVEDAASAASAIGTPLSRSASGGALTPLHVAAQRLAAAPPGSAAARDAAQVALLLTHASGEAALAWFSDPALAAGVAGATPAALAGAAGAALTARLAAHVRRVAAAAATARARAAADPSAAAAAALAAELRRLLRSPPPMPPSAPSRCAAAAAALLRPLVSLRTALGYDDPLERAAFEAHAAAASVKSMQAFLVLVISYLVATKMARAAFLPYPPLSREYLLEHCIGGTRQLVLADFRQTYYRETNAWLRTPTTAAMCALTLPFARIRALYVRRHTALLGMFWVIQFVVCQIYLERLVRSLYDLPAPMVWGCGGNMLQLKVTVLCALVPMRAAPLCALLLARAMLPFIAPYGRIWFVMGPCADGWLPAAPTNAALTAALCALVVWNERRTLRSFRKWRAAEAAHTAAQRKADKKLE